MLRYLKELNLSSEIQGHDAPRQQHGAHAARRQSQIIQNKRQPFGPSKLQSLS
jgi:hypothetical protein